MEPLKHSKQKKKKNPIFRIDPTEKMDFGILLPVAP